MNLVKIVIVFFLLSFVNSYSQIDKSIDSLKKVYIQTQTDSVKMITSYDISVQYWYLNQDSVIHYAALCKQYAEKSDNLNYIAKALNSLGIGYLNKSDFRNSIQYFLDALKMNEKSGDAKNITANLNNIGTAYIRLEDYDKALEYLLKSLDYAAKSNNKKQQDAILLNIGDVYKNKGELDKGLRIFNKIKKSL
jgi:tetratricopeptide (TPR) repeat protein